MGYERRTVFRPVSMVYLLLLVVMSIIFVPLIFLTIGDLLVSALGIPAQWVGVFFSVSLFGSFVNIPVATLESRVPMVRVREVNAFGVTWQIPSVGLGVTRTHVMINLGGGVLPIVVSGYLLGMPLMPTLINPVNEYLAIASVLLIVTVVVNNACWGMSVHGQDAMFGVEGEVIDILVLKQAGLGRINISLDTLDPATFAAVWPLPRREPPGKIRSPSALT